MKSRIGSALSRSATLLPNSALLALERSARLGQGKGWGGVTVVEEVQACLSLLPPGALAGKAALDVGANVGNWTASLLSQSPESTVYCFEPSALAFAQLGSRFGGSDRVHLVNAAAGRETGRAELWADQPGSGLGSLTKRRLDHFGLEFDHSEPVEVLTLDEWCATTGVEPVLLKMDVEGHELDVLAGATAALTSVRVVQFEFGGCNIDTRTYFQDFFYFFRDVGFALNRLTPKGLVSVDRYREEDESFQTTNYFGLRVT